MDVTITKGFSQKTCRGCGVVFYIPDELESKFKNEGGYWSCPNGHQYGYGESDADKYKRLYAQEQAEKVRQLDVARNAIQSAKRLSEQLEKCQEKKRTKKAK